MKKTIATIALAVATTGISCAGEWLPEGSYDVTLDFTAKTPVVTTVAKDGSYVPTITANDTAGFTDVANVTGATASGSGAAQENGVTMTDYTRAMMVVGNNVGNGATDTFTITFTAGCDFTLQSIDLALLTHNSAGNNHSSSPTVKYNFYITGGGFGDSLTALEIATINGGTVNGVGKRSADKVATTAADLVASHGAQAVSTAPQFDLATGRITNGSGVILNLNYRNEPTPIQFLHGETYTLTLEVQRGTNNPSNTGFFAGLGGVKMHVLIPEPATATLSLLALAGLAARRRRK